MNDEFLIVIVDDDQAMRESLSDYFYHANYRVKTYASGVEMLSNMSDNADAIICDLKMPNMDGITVLKKLKLHQQKIPLIMITAHGNIPTAVEAIKYGAYDFISKPFKPAKLQKMIAKAIVKFQPKTNKNTLKNYPLGQSKLAQDFNQQLLECSLSNNNILALIKNKWVKTH